MIDAFEPAVGGEQRGQGQPSGGRAPAELAWGRGHGSHVPGRRRLLRPG